MPKWNVDLLGEHPKHYEIFGDPTADHIDNLVESIRKKGLQHPPEILPDGTIIAGRCRVRAVRRLGWKTVTVKVRKDLAAAGEAAIESHLIEDNLARADVTPVGKARCVARLFELECGRATGPIACEEVKERVGRRLKLSVRSVARYMLLLAAPRPLQDAVDAGEVPFAVGCRAACLPKPVLAKLVAALKRADGRKAGDKIREALGDKGPDSPHRAYVRLLGALSREIPKFRSRSAEIAPGRIARSRAEVRSAITCLRAIVGD